MDDVYVKSLEMTCHAQMVYDHWPYRESTTVEHVAQKNKPKNSHRTHSVNIF